MKTGVTTRSLFRLLISSTISIIVLGLLVAILTGMGQGVTIIISLFYNWQNLLLTIILVNFLALILSHFPYYFDIGIQDKDHKLEWEKSYHMGIFGIVYHTHKGIEFLDDSILINVIRRHIGVITYAIWFYILLKTHEAVTYSGIDCGTFKTGLDTGSIFVVWNIIFILIHLSLQVHQKSIKIQLAEAKTNKEKAEFEKIISSYLIFFQILFLANIIFIAYFIYCVYIDSWTSRNLIMLMALTSLNALLYLFFRIFRSWFVYYSYDSTSPLDTKQYYSRDLTEKFKVWSFIPLRFLSSTPNYLASMSFFGMLSVCSVLVTGLFTENGISCFNAIPLFMILVTLYYSGLVIVLKHYIFYKSQLARGINGTKKNIFMSWFLFLSPIGFVFMFLFMSNADNDLHTLELVPEEGSAICTVDSFARSIDTSLNVHYIVGSYGGGLKADVWNLFLINELIHQKKDFLKSSICFSGVSGGAIGLANFTALFHSKKDVSHSQFDTYISTIGDANMLSADLFGWMIKDFYRETIPQNWFGTQFDGKDRSWVSMRMYSNMVDDNGTGLEKSMRDYWAETFEKYDYFPAIIFNTTPTFSKYGVASSVKAKKFPISVDILSHDYIKGDKKSVSFYGAASTTNRFPLFSPAARVPNKGHFIDGGVFENSGLMNAKSFVDELIDDGGLKIKKLRAINIINDKSIYILEKIRDYDSLFSERIELHEGEYMAIVKGAIALERMPRYMREHISRDTMIDTLITLQMPYILTKEDFMKTLKIEEFSKPQDLVISEIIKSNNKMIIDALKKHKKDNYEIYKLNDWGIVDPPLGRVLSVPAVEYQRAMVKYHKELKDEIEFISSN